MSETTLLSFIIPVYNVEKYLKECLDSIFDPSVNEDEYEVIAIDDGSADSSPEILRSGLRHENFRTITRENQGRGKARPVTEEQERQKGDISLYEKISMSKSWRG